MIDAGTTVAILLLLFGLTVGVGLLLPDSRELVGMRLAGWADAAFSALLVALGAAVERIRSVRGGRPRAEETDHTRPDAGGPDNGGGNGAA